MIQLPLIFLFTHWKCVQNNIFIKRLDDCRNRNSNYVCVCVCQCFWNVAFAKHQSIQNIRSRAWKTSTKWKRWTFAEGEQETTIYIHAYSQSSLSAKYTSWENKDKLQRKSINSHLSWKSIFKSTFSLDMSCWSGRTLVNMSKTYQITRYVNKIQCLF